MNDTTGALPDGEYWSQIAEDYRTGAWRDQLDYSTWAEYMAGEWELGKLSVKTQKAVAEGLRAAGMPVRDICTTVGGKLWVTPSFPVQRIPRSGPMDVGVYLIGSPEFRPVKIGKGDPVQRLADLQTGSPFELMIFWHGPGNLALEAALHRRFRPYRVRGEWFRFPDHLDPVTAVAEAAAELTAGLSVADQR